MHFSKFRWLCIALFIATTLINAPVMAVVAPDAGKTDRNVRDRQFVAPPSSTPDLKLDKRQTTPPIADQGTKIRVDHFRFTGQSIFSEQTLLTQIQDAVGKDLSLADLELIAGRITHYLRDRGYLVATAYIPVQKVQNNTVEIAILLGQYGNITIRNHSFLTTARARSFLSILRRGDYVRSDALERSLLLVDDIGGVKARATLAPGSMPGATDIVVDVTNTKRIDGSLSFDNYGDTSTGQYRGDFTLNIKNLSGIGDQAAIGVVYAGGGMDSGSLTYQVPVGSHGGKLGAGYSRTRYLLGGEFGVLDASGEATTASFFGSYPFVRSRNFNLYGRIGFDIKKLVDRQNATETWSDKGLKILSLGVNGDWRDKDGNGITVFSLFVSRGQLSINTEDGLAIDQISANTNGSYYKTTLNLWRIRQMNKRLSYYLAFRGQLASKNLDSYEKIYLGGATGVRAYPQGEAPAMPGTF